MPWLELYLADLDRRLDVRVVANVGHYLLRVRARTQFQCIYVEFRLDQAD